MGQDELLEEQQRTDREDGRQRLVRFLQRAPEGRAAVAGLEVPADRRWHPLQALGDLAQLEPHLAARQLARLGGLGQ